MTALTLQTGAGSLFSRGFSIGDIAALYQHARTYGNWLRPSKNDHELFESLMEDYGVSLRRRGLVNLTTMENFWSGQTHLVNRGALISDNIGFRESDSDRLGNFTWLMVTVVTALDVCLSPGDVRLLLIDVIASTLQRDDVKNVKESLEVQIQTNIESWRSTGRVRGMVGPLEAAFKDCRLTLTGGASVPTLTRTEIQDLYRFLTWLMAGENNRYLLSSATLYSLAAAMERVGIHIHCGALDEAEEGRVAVRYKDEIDHVEDFLEIVTIDLELLKSRDQIRSVPPQQVSYLCDSPSQMIETFPRSLKLKNQMEKFWLRGAEAAASVKIKAIAPRKATGIMYTVESCVECTRRWEGNLTGVSDEHFPVDSDVLLEALTDMMLTFPHPVRDWLYRGVKLDGGISDLCNNFTEDQMDAFLCYQSLVFGYWYKFVEPLVSMEFVTTQVYFYSVWGFRDTYLLVLLRTIATKFRIGLKNDGMDGPDRKDILRMLSTMFAGAHAYDPAKPILTNGLMAILDKISIVSMSLLKPSDNADQASLFAIVPLQIADLLANENGEVWAGDAAGIQFRSGVPTVGALSRKIPRERWTIHPRMIMSDGRISKVIMVACCGGTVVGTFNPSAADGVLLRTRDNRSGHLHQRHRLKPDSISSGRTRYSPQLRTMMNTIPLVLLETVEKDFQSGVIPYPKRQGEVIIVNSYQNPLMRYAAAGLYSNQSHVVMGSLELDRALELLKEQLCEFAETCQFGVIID